MRGMTHITARVGIVLGAISALLLSMIGPAMAVPVNSYYAPGSFIYSRAESLPVDATLTAQFHNFMATNATQKGTPYPKLNLNDNWAMSYAYGKATDPVWKLTGSAVTGNAKLKILNTQGFHMPDSVASTFPSGTQDRPGVMIDNVFGYTAMFADAVPNLSNHTIAVSSAGIFWHGSNALDYRNPKSNDSRNFTSRGRIPDSMVITREELDQAVAAGTGVGKVLHLFFVETNGLLTPCYSHPMVGCEGRQRGWGAEGWRIRIKPSIDLVARGLSGYALAIARTMQQNGMYLGDNSGSVSQVKMSQTSHYTGTGLTTTSLKGKITWNDFEVVTPGAQ
jgi:hypothetical protein